jgi:hypothetical protein
MMILNWICMTARGVRTGGLRGKPLFFNPLDLNWIMPA